MQIEPQHVKRDFDAAAHSYALHADVQWDILQQLIELASPYIKPDAHVLDIGCGPGWLKDVLSAQNVDWWVAGVDIAESMCQQAFARGMESVCASAELLPFRPDSFDAIVSSLCVQWLSEPGVFLREMARALKPGGYAAIATLGPQTLTELRDSFAAHDEAARVMTFRNEKEWGRMAKEEGLIVTHMHTSLWHYPYASLAELLRILRHIGATNKHPARTRGLSGADLFTRVECSYEERYARAGGGIWASWQPLTLIVRKP